MFFHQKASTSFLRNFAYQYYASNMEFYLNLIKKVNYYWSHDLVVRLTTKRNWVQIPAPLHRPLTCPIQLDQSCYHKIGRK
jgi:hypothetical protein